MACFADLRYNNFHTQKMRKGNVIVYEIIQ